jgi:hypothetical protein
MDDSNTQALLSAMRAQAWERAKGELNAVLAAFVGHGKFEAMDKAVADFISTVEDDGLFE